MIPSITRAAILMAPASAAFILELARNHSPRLRSAALFAALWVFLSALAINAFAVGKNWWGFTTRGAALYGVPVDVMIALGLFSGAGVLVAKGKWGYMAAGLLTAVAIFLLYMPVCGLVVLHEGSCVGILILEAVSLPVAFLLAYWTAYDRSVYARSFFQALIWVELLLWLLPSAAMVNGGGNWDVLARQSPLLFAPMLIPGALVANALYVFAKVGDGTGFPYDPPKKLVTQGMYQYISNPMQLAICIAMAWWGFLLKNWIVFICAPVAVILFVVFRDVCNGSSNLCGDDPEWRRYHERVPRWFPEIKPKV